ncbi:uncharacterized protein LOC143847908 [Tasmannia lanceolata]|uniref:uncharacterized protein LOC143847908 n=1 Tax=Tasmannia lanceolata TaxID=3420 RepID=UPI0040647412
MLTSIPYAVVWHIWNEHNNRIFCGKERGQPYITLDTKLSIIKWAHAKGGNPYSVGEILRNCFKVASEKKYHSKLLPKWTPPPEGWFKLNFYGSSRGSPGMAGVGGVIRDHNGSIIMSSPAGVCDANEAEVSVLLVALKWYALTQSRSTKEILQIQLHGRNKKCGPWRISYKIDQIWDLIAIIHFSLTHMRLSANRMADELAKEGVDRDYPYC